MSFKSSEGPKFRSAPKTEEVQIHQFHQIVSRVLNILRIIESGRCQESKIYKGSIKIKGEGIRVSFSSI